MYLLSLVFNFAHAELKFTLVLSFIYVGLRLSLEFSFVYGKLRLSLAFSFHYIRLKLSLTFSFIYARLKLSPTFSFAFSYCTFSRLPSNFILLFSSKLKMRFERLVTCSSILVGIWVCFCAANGSPFPSNVAISLKTERDAICSNELVIENPSGSHRMRASLSFKVTRSTFWHSGDSWSVTRTFTCRENRLLARLDESEDMYSSYFCW